MQTLESTFNQTGTYAIDPAHSRVGFAARYAMVSVIRGSFNRFEGGGCFDIERPENSFVDITIDATSIDTRHHERDAHLRSTDFLDVATHPQITFSGTSVEQVGVRTYRVTGELTAKGITNPVVIEAERTGWATQDDGTQRIGFEGRAIVNRQDWDIGWNRLLDTGGVLISDHITVEFEISAVKTTAPRPMGGN